MIHIRIPIQPSLYDTPVSCQRMLWLLLEINIQLWPGPGPPLRSSGSNWVFEMKDGYWLLICWLVVTMIMLMLISCATLALLCCHHVITAELHTNTWSTLVVKVMRLRAELGLTSSLINVHWRWRGKLLRFIFQLITVFPSCNYKKILHHWQCRDLTVTTVRVWSHLSSQA